MHVTYLLIALCALFAASFVDIGHAAAQGGRNASLAADHNRGGSAPYRETVDRFLKRQEPKIVGGKEAPAGAYPWQISVGVSWIADPYRAHFCGGTVYSSSWILTAAHCVEGTLPKDVVVTAGTHKLGSGGSRHNVKRIIVKSDFDPKTFDNDVALLELFDPLLFRDEVKAIPLVRTAEETKVLKTDTPLTVLGWGATNEGGRPVRDLRFVEVPFVDRATCNRPLAYDGRVTTNMICAGRAVGGQDSCQGDSGGPLTVSTQADPKLAGVVSWGDGCARPNRVGIYTRVANYEQWIAACITKPETCK